MDDPVGIDRRTALKFGSCVLLNAVPGLSLNAEASEQVLYGSAFQDHSGRHGFALFSPSGSISKLVELPNRGHDVVVNPSRSTCVVFARRPGNFAVAIHLNGDTPPVFFQARSGRHFYGHGCFSANGKLLYASENDYENAEGKIGIYEASNGFKKVDEVPSYGLGPHELVLNHQENLLIVANGGIETHPEFGRRKLNLASMEPSLVYINTINGALVERQVLPAQFAKLSIRHLAFGVGNSILFACQNEGWFPGSSPDEQVPLVGISKRGQSISLFDINGSNWAAYNGYIGSIATTDDGLQFAVTSPKGGVVSVFETSNQKKLKDYRISQASGLAYHAGQFSITSAAGIFAELAPQSIDHIIEKDWRFENHFKPVR